SRRPHRDVRFVGHARVLGTRQLRLRRERVAEPRGETWLHDRRSGCRSRLLGGRWAAAHARRADWAVDLDRGIRASWRRPALVLLRGVRVHRRLADRLAPLVRLFARTTRAVPAALLGLVASSSPNGAR